MSDQDDSLQPPPPPLPKKKGMSTGCIVALVLGAGICVVLLLLTLAVLAGQYVMINRRSDRAMAQMKGLELAVKGYQTEYSRLPALESSPPTEDNSKGYDTASESGRGIIKILIGEDTQKNPRRIPFYEPPAARKGLGGYTDTNGLVDIWGAKGYIMILDYDGDGEINDPAHPGAKISASVIVYSAGADLDYTTWKDNVTSWEQ